MFNPGVWDAALPGDIPVPNAADTYTSLFQTWIRDNPGYATLGASSLIPLFLKEMAFLQSPVPAGGGNWRNFARGQANALVPVSVLSALERLANVVPM